MTKLNNDEAFKHISYHATDVRKTWARERKRLAEEKARRETEAAAVQQEQSVKVRRIAK